MSLFLRRAGGVRYKRVLGALAAFSRSYPLNNPVRENRAEGYGTHATRGGGQAGICVVGFTVRVVGGVRLEDMAVAGGEPVYGIFASL